MENKPESDPALDNKKEDGMPFSEKLLLAQTLSEAVNKRNDYIRTQGGFDTFAEVGQYLNNSRAVYDELSEAATKAIEEFDREVSDKAEFVAKLKSFGELDLAARLSSMFSIPTETNTAVKKRSFLSRFF